jgi:hypothetical protein
VVVAFVVVESDAEGYARQIYSLLLEAGFDAKFSDYILTSAPHAGLFVCASADGSLAPQAAAIQAAFAEAGVAISSFPAPTIMRDLSAPESSAVLVVSTRE